MWHTDLALLILRVALGGFFVGYRFRWFYDPSATDQKWFSPSRRAALQKKMCQCGYGRNPWLAAFVAWVELLAGLGVVFGLLTSLSALGLLAVLVFATCCTAKEKVLRQFPVDPLDACVCYFWTVEPLYIAITIVLLLCGSGHYAIDAFIRY